MLRKTSAGAILTDGKVFLVCHATGQLIWDLPKGGVDPGEDLLAACIREVKEETNFDVPEDAIIEDLGCYPYLPAKDLYLFRITLKQLPSIDDLKCTSIVNLEGKPPFPEADAYIYITPKIAEQYMSKNLRRTLTLAAILPGNVGDI
jgi:8-oxo-dGTP pyrophosphatase MutT (NUDIX family)